MIFSSSEDRSPSTEFVHLSVAGLPGVQAPSSDSRRNESAKSHQHVQVCVPYWAIRGCLYQGPVTSATLTEVPVLISLFAGLPTRSRASESKVAHGYRRHPAPRYRDHRRGACVRRELDANPPVESLYSLIFDPPIFFPSFLCCAPFRCCGIETHRRTIPRPIVAYVPYSVSRCKIPQNGCIADRCTARKSGYNRPCLFTGVTTYLEKKGSPNSRMFKGINQMRCIVVAVTYCRHVAV